MGRPGGRRGGPPTPNNKGLQRSIAYLRGQGRRAILPYTFLIIATLSQLAVPRLVRDIIDAVTNGYVASQVLDAWDKIPTAFQSAAVPQLLEAFALPADWSQDQLLTEMQARFDGAPQALLNAAIAIVIFAALRGVFAFLQTFWAERNSQGVAFDLRNDLYAKIQRLSFSYYDQNQTGQLMIRATDDVEKVRLFLGQGLVQLVGAVVLLTGTLVVLFT
ncbi:MAG TPA: ABC transporter transmembrane domain-containing protein, partial [Anaerolineales bacterium]|nr:ABC transporter transmembrane domain-containing protein [Anaerolineales bacterium]